MIVVEKESNKAIIVDIASPYVMKRRVKRLRNTKIWRERLKIMGYQTCGSDTGSGYCTRYSEQKIGYMDCQAGDYHTGLLQKTAFLGTARILSQEDIGKLNEEN